MVTVRTNEELKAAFAAKERKIVVVGKMAEEMAKKAKKKKNRSGQESLSD